MVRAARLSLTHKTLYRMLVRLEAEGQVIRRGSELRLAKHRRPRRRGTAAERHGPAGAAV
jgi:hypothetical protein